MFGRKHQQELDRLDVNVIHLWARITELQAEVARLTRESQERTLKEAGWTPTSPANWFWRTPAGNTHPYLIFEEAWAIYQREQR